MFYEDGPWSEIRMRKKPSACLDKYKFVTLAFIRCVIVDKMLMVRDPVLSIPFYSTHHLHERGTKMVPVFFVFFFEAVPVSSGRRSRAGNVQVNLI